MEYNNLTIPEDKIELFTYFTTLPEQKEEELINYIVNAPFGVSPTRVLINLHKDLPHIVSEDSAFELLEVFFKLSDAKENLEYNDQEFITDLNNALKENNIINEETNSLNFFKCFFNSENNLSIYKKIYQNFIDNKSNYNESSITTDIRPVFNNENTLLGSAIINNLKIIYTKNNSKQEFFVTLEDSEIEELIGLLKITLDKNYTIKNSLNKELKFINI